MSSISNDSNKNVYTGKSWVDAGVYIRTRTEAGDKNSWEDRIGRRLSRMIQERDAAIAYQNEHMDDKRTKVYKEKHKVNKDMYTKKQTQSTTRRERNVRDVSCNEQQEMSMGR